MHRSIRMLWSAALLGAVVSAAWSAPSGRAARAAAAGADTALVHVGPAEEGTRAFVAWPPGTGEVPSIVVVHEWWGLNDQIRDVARRLAAQGYAVIVPDLYHGRVATDPEKAHELMRGIEDHHAMADLDAAASWLRARPRSSHSKIGVMGFCMGGGVALQYGLANSELSSVVMFYGPPELDTAKLAHLSAPLQGHFGATDEGIPPARVGEFKAALAKAGRSAELFEYPGAGHAFMNDARPSYRPDAARQAWARTLAFLQKHLKA